MVHPPASEADARFMRIALGLARRALGRSWPNPSVGCVLVRPDGAAGRIVGRGWTQAGGRPHAETEAIGRAGEDARGATAYVTFEPCCHHGKTPPCTDALIAAGVGRVVVAMEDPDPRVSGGGLAALESAGIEVETGVLAEQAAEINAGFILAQRQGRPMVTLKVATTIDGKIAVANGDSKWITGQVARRRAHRMRADHDAVAVGSGTAEADDPALTCRLPGLDAASPARVVFDSTLKLSPGSQLARSADEHQVIVVTGTGADAGRRSELEACGVRLLEVEAGSDGKPDPAAALAALAALGVTRLLIEGGGVLAGALINADLVDRIAWFRAASLVGDDGRGAIGPLGIDRLADAPRFIRTGMSVAGSDVLETYRRRA